MQLRLREQSPLMCQTHTADKRPDSLLSSFMLVSLTIHTADRTSKTSANALLAGEAPARFGAIGKCRRSQTWQGIAVVCNKLPPTSS